MQRTEETLTPAKKKFIKVIKTRFPDISENEIRLLLSDVKLFITTVQKINAEPQYRIVNKIKKKGKTKTQMRIVNTDFEELIKIASKDKEQNLSKILKKFIRLTKEKND
jgi:hypothetical protein